MELSAGVKRVLAKLDEHLAGGNYYEAQQMFKTMYSRYRARKQLLDSYNMVENGAILQLQKGQLTCGSELANLLIEAYETDGVVVDETSMGRVWRVFEAFPQSGGANELTLRECRTFIVAAAKWTGRFGSGEQTQQLHTRLADYIMSLQGWRGLGTASVHYIRGINTEAFAAALSRSIQAGEAQEEDLFLARAVLLVLSLGEAGGVPSPHPASRVQAARKLLAAYQAKAGALPGTPLMNCVSLFLEALLQSSAGLAHMLEQEYQTSLQRDPQLQALLRELTARYLSTGAGLGGLLGNLTSMLRGAASEA